LARNLDVLTTISQCCCARSRLESETWPASYHPLILLHIFLSWYIETRYEATPCAVQRGI
jgi:hypothetical protein